MRIATEHYPQLLQTMPATDLVSLLYAIRAAVHAQINASTFNKQLMYGNVYARVIEDYEMLDLLQDTITLASIESFPYEQMKSFPRNSLTPVRFIVEPEYKGLIKAVETIYKKAKLKTFECTVDEIDIALLH